MADFASAISTLLRHEGGYQDNPDDIGNYDTMGNLIGTNMGITPKTYYRYFGRWPSSVTMKTLPAIDAIAIYRFLYWDKYRLYHIADQAVADHILDTLVLHGRGAELIQTAVNEMNYPLPIDNIYGNNTNNAVIDLSSNPRSAVKFNDKLVDVRIGYVEGLAASNAAFYQFLPGWKKRIKEFWSGTKKTKIILVASLVGVGLLTFFPEVRRFLRLPF